MTKKQIDKELFIWRGFVDEKITEMKNGLRDVSNPEDFVKNNRVFGMIENNIADIRQAQTKIDELEDMIPDEDDSDAFTGTAFLNSFNRFG